MKYFLLSMLILLEFFVILIIYSLLLGFFDESKINLYDFIFQLSNFNFFNFMSSSFYYFITTIIMEAMKVSILYFIVLFIFNLLLFKKVLNNKIYISCLFFCFAFIILSLFYDSNFVNKENLSFTINLFITI